MTKPEGAYYFDQESGLWVTDGKHDKQHYFWYLEHRLGFSQEAISAMSDEDHFNMADMYAADYLSF